MFDWIVLFGTIFGLFMLIASPNIIIERYADFEYYKTIAKLFMVTSIFSVFAHRLFKYAMKKE